MTLKSPFSTEAGTRLATPIAAMPRRLAGRRALTPPHAVPGLTRDLNGQEAPGQARGAPAQGTEGTCHEPA